MRTIAVVTGARSEYGLLRPVLERIVEHEGLDLQLIVTGAHLAPSFGSTVNEIEADGFEIGERIEILMSSDSPVGVATSTSVAVMGFAQAYARRRPDLLLLLGDRYEMHAAAVAASPFLLPIAHIAGGEVTEGALDDALRHSLTKLSHLHFASTADAAARVMQMGEEASRVIVVGALGVERVLRTEIVSRQQLEERNGISLPDSYLLVTFHPATLEGRRPPEGLDALLGALGKLDLPAVFTYPGADTGYSAVLERLQRFASEHPNARLFASLGDAYVSVMAHAAAMVGNSSSGLVEAPSLHLPVVNIGSRQDGRLRAANVIDVRGDQGEIIEAIRTALSARFREDLAGTTNPYGDGRTSHRIVSSLAGISLGDALLRKKFVTVLAPTG